MNVSLPTCSAPADRAKTFGVYGTVMGGSSDAGMILEGVLTDYAG